MRALIYSAELKKKIRERLIATKITLYSACDMCEVDYDHMSQFLNRDETTFKQKKKTESEIEKLCTFLGIELRLLIVMKDIEKCPARILPRKTRKQRNKEWHEKKFSRA